MEDTMAQACAPFNLLPRFRARLSCVPVLALFFLALAPGVILIVLCTKILNGNKKGTKPTINLKGLGLGNAWVDPYIQFGSYPDFGLMHGLVSQGTYSVYEDLYAGCKKMLDEENWIASAAECYGIPGLIIASNPGMEIYDIRKKCPGLTNHDCYNFTAAEKWLDLPTSRKLLGVGDHTLYLDHETPDAIISVLDGDSELSFRKNIHDLLGAGGRVLVYNGEWDFMCNWIGGHRWVSQMMWPGQQAFNAAANVTWHNKKGEVAGWVQGTPDRQLQFIKIANSGHLVPHDQPSNALEMLSRFLNNQTWSL